MIVHSQTNRSLHFQKFKEQIFKAVSWLEQVTFDVGLIWLVYDV